MTITNRVQQELVESVPTSHSTQKRRISPYSGKNKGQVWTKEEHAKFLEALEIYPSGPWKAIADYIGTRSPRQTMTHSQKLREKFGRRSRGLRKRRNKRKASRSSVTERQQGTTTSFETELSSVDPTPLSFVETLTFPNAEMGPSGMQNMVSPTQTDMLVVPVAMEQLLKVEPFALDSHWASSAHPFMPSDYIDLVGIMDLDAGAPVQHFWV